MMNAVNKKLVKVFSFLFLHRISVHCPVCWPTNY